MARPKKPINWEDCPVRKCRSEQICMICGEFIPVDDMYFDAGNNKRVHVGCVGVPELSAPQESVEEEASVQDVVDSSDNDEESIRYCNDAVREYNMKKEQNGLVGLHNKLNEQVGDLLDRFKKLQDQVLSLASIIRELQSQIEDLEERKANKDEIESFDPRELDFYDDLHDD